VNWTHLSARALDQRELVLPVDEWPASPTSGAGSSAFPLRDASTCARLQRDHYVDVWAICWTRGSDTGWHEFGRPIPRTWANDDYPAFRNALLMAESADRDLRRGLALPAEEAQDHRLGS